MPREEAACFDPRAVHIHFHLYPDRFQAPPFAPEPTRWELPANSHPTDQCRKQLSCDSSRLREDVRFVLAKHRRRRVRWRERIFAIGVSAILGLAFLHVFSTAPPRPIQESSASETKLNMEILSALRALRRER